MTEQDPFPLLSALANPTRLKVVIMLAEDEVRADGMSPKAIAEALGLPGNLLHAHLLILVKAGLVRVERSGRAAAYRIASEALLALGDRLQALGRGRTKH